MRPLLSALLLLPGLALAQDGFIPYGEPEPEAEAPAPTRRYEPGPPLEAADREGRESFSRLDDPNTGLAFEGLAGLLLLDGSRGQLLEPRASAGARLTWELGRVFGSEALRESLLLDASWWYAASREGTPGVYVDSQLHAASLAPAWLFRLGPNSPLSLYLQAGGGVAFQPTSVTASGGTTHIAGLRPLVQYGVGLRGRPQVGEHLHVSFRVELTRFRRGYHDDTYLGGSLGLAF